MDTRETLLDILKHLEFDPEEIDDSTALQNQLGVDSTELAEIAVAVERRFSIVIDDSEFQKAATFGDMRKYVESLRYQG
jgi:acyl carrier protein